VSVQVLEGQLSSVKAYMTEHCATDDADAVLLNVELLLVNVDKLPPNQRVMLQNFYEEVSDSLTEKQSDVDSMLQCLQSAQVAYEVTLLFALLHSFN